MKPIAGGRQRIARGVNPGSYAMANRESNPWPIRPSTDRMPPICGEVRRGAARCGEVRRGAARCGEVRRGAARCGGENGAVRGERRVPRGNGGIAADPGLTPRAMRCHPPAAGCAGGNGGIDSATDLGSWWSTGAVPPMSADVQGSIFLDGSLRPTGRHHCTADQLGPDRQRDDNSEPPPASRTRWKGHRRSVLARPRASPCRTGSRSSAAWP